MRIDLRSLLLATAFLCPAAAIHAQDNLELGKMWTFENPPLAYLEKEYAFKPTQDWLDRVRLASLRFGQGCSASFVSPKGLIMTNHHCVRGNIAQVQGKHDWVKDGYAARTPADEVKLDGLTVQQLIAQKDVTAEVNAGGSDGDDESAVTERRETNKESILAAAKTAKPEYTHQIVELFQGAIYQLYSYKVYADIRLVVAPHLQAAHFGGDFDNFTYPRFGIDFSFCRAYEDDKPADTSAHYFKWCKQGVKEGDLTFITGNPGSTQRLLTYAQFVYKRDANLPIICELIDNRLAIMRRVVEEVPQLEKQLRTTILQFENSQKALRGMLNALEDGKFMAAKLAAEAKFKAHIEAKPENMLAYGSVWDEIAGVAKAQTALEARARFHRSGGSWQIDRAIAMLDAVHDGEQTSIDDVLRIQSRRSPMQSAFFVDHLVRAQNWLPKDDAFLKVALGDLKAPAAAARINKSRMGDDAFIKELLAKGKDAVLASDDIAVQIAVILRPKIAANRAEGRLLNNKVAFLGNKIGQALFAAYGTKVSPDATFTLRFSDGRVAGYECNGTRAPYRTTFFGMYARNEEFDNAYPFNLPQAWRDKQDMVNLRAGVNYVCTNDSTGGNSGSPIINKDMEIVGLLFDGNIESLANDFMFKQKVERSVSVHTDAIMEALTKIYDAQRIADELKGL